MKRFVVVMTVWAMGLAGVLAGVVFPSSASAAPTIAGAYDSVAPFRLLNTLTGVGATKAAVPARGIVHLQVTGVPGGVPAGVRTVVLNVATLAPASAGYITVFAGGSPARPNASNLNFLKGQTATNLVIAPVSATGVVDLYNGSDGTVQLVADVSGYYLSGAPKTPGAYDSVAPSRLLNTITGVGAAKAVVAARATVHLQVTGVQGGVPAGVRTVVLNVATVAPASAGYITVHDGMTTRPTASNLNFLKGQTATNLVIAPVSDTGIVDLYNGSDGTTQLVADVSGYFLSGAPIKAGAFGSLAPSRLLNTITGVGAPKTAVLARGSVHLQVSGVQGGAPAGVSAVVLNVAAVAPAGAGYITVHDGTTTRPNASNLNFLTGQTATNLVIAKVGANGIVDLYNGSDGTVQLVADVSGYYLSSDVNVAPGPVTGQTATVVSPTSIRLDWTNPTADFATVIVRRLQGAIAPKTILEGTDVPVAAGAASVTDIGLIAGTQYSYAIFALDALGLESEGAEVADVTTAADTVAPAPVTGLTSSATTVDSIALTWVNPTTDFTGVMIRRSPGTAVPTLTTGVELTGGVATATSYVDANLNASTQYTYAVFAHDGAVPANYAVAAVLSPTTTALPDTTPPFPVSGLTLGTITDTSIALSWTNPTADFTGVTIRRGLGDVAPATVTAGTAVSTASATTAVDDTLVAGQMYSYSVFAHDGALPINNNAPPTKVTATTTGVLVPDTTVPGKVTGLSVSTTSVSDHFLVLNWTNPTDADFKGVLVRRLEGTVAPASITDGTWVQDFTDGADYVSDIGLTELTTYTYAFFSYDTTGNYSLAATATGTTQAIQRSTTAVLSADSAKGTAGTPINFDASLSHGATGTTTTTLSGTLDYGDGTAPEVLSGDSWNWFFGHTFDTAGPQTVTLDITDSAGVHLTQVVTVDIFAAPTASITIASPAGPIHVGTVVTFNLASSTPAGTAFTNWSVRGDMFGDFNFGTAPATYTYTFTTAGPVTVDFSRDNDAFGTALSSIDLTVLP